jgi:PHD/YefM family antitoxin component YafN of YafNO toxin-antitoxin module
LTADLSRPVIIEREGHPFGVFVAYDDYKRLKDAAEENTRRRKQAFERIDALLAEIQSRVTEATPDEIEAEVSAAVKEVRSSSRN